MFEPAISPPDFLLCCCSTCCSHWRALQTAALIFYIKLLQFLRHSCSSVSVFQHKRNFSWKPQPSTYFCPVSCCVINDGNELVCLFWSLVLMNPPAVGFTVRSATVSVTH